MTIDRYMIAGLWAIWLNLLFLYPLSGEKVSAWQLVATLALVLAVHVYWRVAVTGAEEDL
jgi:hypothetical protein